MFGSEPGNCRANQRAEKSTTSQGDQAVNDWVHRTSEGGTKAIEAGDRVAYSKKWLRSTGQMTGDTPQARGTVVEMQVLGSIRLAVIQWDHPDFPEKVNVMNLSRVRDGVILDRD
jgi:hypothetical protein